MILSRSRQVLGLAALSVGIAVAGTATTPGNGLVATTLNDFHMPGTQPGELVQNLLPSADCSGCHGNYAEDQEPYRRWAASMMGQAGRDPIFYAALAIAEQASTERVEKRARSSAAGAAASTWPQGWPEATRPTWLLSKPSRST